MILTYEIHHLLWLYHRGKISSKYLNPKFTQYHADAWTKFFLEIKKIESKTAGRYTWAYLDRSGTIPSPVLTLVSLENQLPKINPSFERKSYLDICLARARDLINTGKIINVLWSGGLDSTVALFSLLDQCNNIDQLNVVCTFESIIESGSIFDKYIKDSGLRIKFDQTRLNPGHSFTYDEEDTTQLYVSGCCGDQLFGMSPGPRAFSLPDKSLLDKWQGIYNTDFISVLEPTFIKSPRPIENVRDLLWWLHFNFFWTTAYYDEKRARTPSVAQRLISFYGTQEFQTWAANTKTYYEKIDQYRWPAKQALTELIDVPYYAMHKKKSMSHTWLINKQWYMMDENYQNYFIEQ